MKKFMLLTVLLSLVIVSCEHSHESPCEINNTAQVTIENTFDHSFLVQLDYRIFEGENGETLGWIELQNQVYVGAKSEIVLTVPTNIFIVVKCTLNDGGDMLWSNNSLSNYDNCKDCDPRDYYTQQCEEYRFAINTRTYPY